MVLILIMKKINSEKIQSNYQILNRMIIVKALREITIKKNYFWLWHKWKLFIEHLHRPQRVAKRGWGWGETDPVCARISEKFTRYVYFKYFER